MSKGHANQGLADQAKEIFLDALEVSPAEREAFLATRCASDGMLLERVRKLLSAHTESSELFGAVSPSDAAAGNRPGTSIGSFELVEEIGEGGFAIVWRAQQRVPVEREVALKILKRGMETAESIARLESERQALAMMDHPGIAKILDGGTTDNRLPWFAMELVDGQSITEFCARTNPDRKTRLRLFQEVCGAVQHAHRRGVLHRDLKPSNILVTEGQQGPRVKVIDFGIAKMIDHAAAKAAVHTVEGHWVGTPGYMSPEQLDEHPDLDTRSDVYSLGVLLYELLSGARPIDDDTLRSASTSEVIRLIREVDPPKPSTRAGVRELRGELDWITMRCLEKDRERRYGSVGELAADIQNHLDGAPVLAGPPHFRYRFSKFVRKYRIPLGVAALTAILLIGGIASSLVQLRRVRAAEADLKDQVAKTEVELAKFLGISAFYESVLLSVDPGFARGMDSALIMRVLESASLRIERESEGNAEVEATIRRVIGGAYAKLGQLDQAQAELERAYDLRLEQLGPLNRDTCDSMLELGHNYLEHGRATDALPLLKSAFEGFTQFMGPESELTLNAQSVYAVALKTLRRTDEAVEHMRSIETSFLELYGEKNEDSIRAMSNLASTLNELGQRTEALARYQRAAELQLEVQGSQHPETLMAFNNLAQLYSDEGHSEEALTTLEQVHDIKLEVLPAGHPSRLLSYNNLAMTAKETGDRERAKDLLRAGMAEAKAAAARGTPNGLSLQTNYARFVSGDGKIDEARDLFHDSAELARHSLGDDSPFALAIEGLYIGFLIEKLDPEEAEFLAVDVVERARLILAPNDSQLAIHICRHAEALMKQDRLEEARPYVEECLAITREAGPEDTLQKAEAFLERIETRHAQER